MSARALAPLVGSAMAVPITAVAPHAGRQRSFVSIIGQIRKLGLVVCPQGAGFAAIGAFMPPLFCSKVALMPASV